MKKNKAFPLLIFFFSLCAPALAQNKPIVIQNEYLPELSSLNNRIPVPEEKKSMLNYLLKDYNDDIQNSYKEIARGEPVRLSFYRYIATKEDSILSLSARLNIPQETLATANHLDSADASIAGKELILPTAPGLFIPQKPITALEILLANENASRVDSAPLYTLGGMNMYFLQNQKLSPTQRAFFLDASMIIPLDDSVLSSDFGYRVSPISGRWKFHSGVDLAAPIGTPVHACKWGKVQSAIQGDNVFGNYIILQHTNGMTSVYAHLSQILVKQGDIVSKGKEIGKVGTTGASTGPHLHFEVRQNGRPMNPLR